MTININNLIEDFILGNLNGKKQLDFQHAMENSPELASEVEFNKELSDAIRENDVMELRSNLKQIIQQESKHIYNNDSVFDLAQNLKHVQVNNPLDDEKIKIENTLQFIHIENFKKSQTERKHLIPLSDENEKVSNSSLINDEKLWQEISVSLQEKDIIDLRNNLKQIISMGNTETSDFEIDQFLDNDLPEEALVNFQYILKEDNNMTRQIKLHHEIEDAILETDIRALRNSISKIIEEEQMISYSEIKRIDDYLMNYLDFKEQQEFEELSSENPKLATEVHLNREINNALLENDIMDLRSTIGNITNEEHEDTKMRQLIPNRFNTKTSRYIGVAASVAAVISVGVMTLNKEKTSAEELYKNVYHPYEATGLYRSDAVASPEIIGIDLYNEKNYSGALDRFKIILNENSEHPICNFYSGLCYQQLGDYKKAITSYQNVIDERDNLFIEQAEWYKALAQLQINDLKNAYQSFSLIVKNNGYYSKNAKEIIGKLKY